MPGPRRSGRPSVGPDRRGAGDDDPVTDAHGAAETTRGYSGEPDETRRRSTRPANHAPAPRRGQRGRSSHGQPTHRRAPAAQAGAGGGLKLKKA